MGRSCLTGGVKLWRKRRNFLGVFGGTQLDNPRTVNCADGKEGLMRVGTLMTTHPVTVTPQATVAEALDLMRDLDIRHLPVVEGGALVGMLSDRDLANLNVGAMLTDQGADAVRRELTTPVIKVMRPDVIWVEPETDLSDVIELLLEHKIGAVPVPVIRRDTQAVVGIVSYIDVLRAVQDGLEDEETG
jgi:CBS domain-containing protein